MKIRKFLPVATILSIVATFAFLIDNGKNTANGATANFPTSVQVTHWNFTLDAAYTGTSTAHKPVRFVVPAAYTLLTVGCSAEAIDLASGNEQYYVDVLENGVSMLSTPIVIGTQSATLEATLTDTAIADEAVIQIATYGTGTTPSLAQLNVWMDLLKK